ncbi:hypothetical protein CBR_g51925 [Chara braunii]|uniref:LysM domain-containing protein n=1 Tax=Chara braunii TaxID=69332 RepID=A0A388M9G5_CHABU|nr:hypothetical protein CBR_g51925 [Chara braunii]|eukprot:GBG91123.1 hypothetical protein CBR_g51925 [Chara braunii]
MAQLIISGGGGTGAALLSWRLERWHLPADGRGPAAEPRSSTTGSTTGARHAKTRGRVGARSRHLRGDDTCRGLTLPRQRGQNCFPPTNAPVGCVVSDILTSISSFSSSWPHRPRDGHVVNGLVPLSRPLTTRVPATEALFRRASSAGYLSLDNFDNCRKTSFDSDVERAHGSPSPARRHSSSVAMAATRANVAADEAATSTTTPPSPAAAAAPGKPSGESMVYVVQPGEWLSFIARKHHVSLQDVLDANPDLDPDDVYDSQEIIIPLDKDERGERREAGEEGSRASAANWTDNKGLEAENQYRKQVDGENQEQVGGASSRDGESEVSAMASSSAQDETEAYKKREEDVEGGLRRVAVVLGDSSAERSFDANGKEGQGAKEEGEDDEEEEEEEGYYDQRQEEEEKKAMTETREAYGDVGEGSREEGRRSGRRVIGAPQPSMLPTEVYKIKTGDRLKLIARRRGIDMRDLELLNPGLDVTDVRVGDSVLLPKVGVYQRRPPTGLQLAVASACLVLMAGLTIWAFVSLIRALLGKVSPRREGERDPELGILIPKGLELQEGPADLHQPESPGEKAGSRFGGKLELGTVEIRGSFAFWPWLLAHQWLRRDFARFQALADEIDLAAADAGKRIRQLLCAWVFDTFDCSTHQRERAGTDSDQHEEIYFCLGYRSFRGLAVAGCGEAVWSALMEGIYKVLFMGGEMVLHQLVGEDRSILLGA